MRELCDTPLRDLSTNATLFQNFVHQVKESHIAVAFDLVVGDLRGCVMLFYAFRVLGSVSHGIRL